MPVVTVQNQCGCKSGKNNSMKGPAELDFKPYCDLRRESFLIKLVDNMEDLKRGTNNKGCS